MKKKPFYNIFKPLMDREIKRLQKKIGEDIKNNRIKIIKRINGDIWLIDEFGTKIKGREKIYCKCGFWIDLWGARKFGRACPIHYAVKCKRCGRESPVMEAELYY